MNIVIISLIVTLQAIAHTYSFNTGTVLFDQSELNKTCWSTTDVGLLRAIRFFKTIMPLPSDIDTSNEDGVNNLLDYLNDAFKTIKKRSSNAEENKILAIALSDVVGGYLKHIALPVSKFAYYGGTLPKTSAVKLVTFYNDVKRHLNTDGSGWASPNEKLLNSVTIKIAPSPRQSHTRSMSIDPCSSFAYFEVTPKGLAIPCPIIKWDNDSSTIFFPLSNQSFYNLESSQVKDTFFNYYDTASNCVKSKSPSDLDDFDFRFQVWLTGHILPHLNDDTFYFALGSVLSLLNSNTTELKPHITLFSIQNSESPNTHCHYNFFSKKVLIIAAILVLEILGCIPAIAYMTCVRKKEKTKDSHDDDVLGFGQGRASSRSSITSDNGCLKTKYVAPTCNRFRVSQLPHEPHVTLKPICTLSATTCTRSLIRTEDCSTQIAAIINETPTINKTKYKLCNNRNIGIGPSVIPQTINKVHLMHSVNDTYRLKPEESTSDTLMNVKNNSVTGLTSQDSIARETKITITRPRKKIKDKRESRSTGYKHNKNNEVIKAEQESKFNLCLSKPKEELADQLDFITKEEMESTNTKLDVKKNCPCKIASSVNFFEIEIGREQDIDVDIRPPTSLPKPSKIPKRTASPNVRPEVASSPCRKKTIKPGLQIILNLDEKQKTMIPQRKKRTSDDGLVKHSKCTQKDNKLNVTL